MLILSRKIGESLIINDSIEVKVIDVNGDKIKLGIKAPADVKVLRSELCQTAEANRDSANSKNNKQLIEFIRDLK
ncbi:MAG: carbon storage regulator CsrA [Clostridiales bacterium]|jgi:carbon storage regulator|nr:carbon storage regulator CsrA [Clostridiales bacterium]